MREVFPALAVALILGLLGYPLLGIILAGLVWIFLRIRRNPVNLDSDTPSSAPYDDYIAPTLESASELSGNGGSFGGGGASGSWESNADSGDSGSGGDGGSD